MQYMGMQFDRESIQKTVATINAQKAGKRDFIYPTATLAFTDAGELQLMATQSFRVGDRSFVDFADAERHSDETHVKLEVESGLPPVTLTANAESQLFQAMGLPVIYKNRLIEKNYRDLLSHNMNELLKRDSRRFLLRLMPNADGKLRCRAVLSDKYRMIDNADLFFCVAEAIHEEIEPGKNRAQAWKCRLWDDGFEMFAVSPHIEGEVSTTRTFDPGDGWRSRWYGQAGDVHNAACRITNSETGRGGCNVDDSIMRRVCANFCVWGDKVTQIHVGKRSMAEGLLVSEDTLAKESEVVWLKIRDAIRTIFDPTRFAAVMKKLQGLTEQELKAPERAVDAVVNHYQISEERKALILGHLLSSGDRSRFGLVQAFTATSHDLDRTGEHELASRLEEAGGALVSMEDRAFASLVS